MRRCLKTILFFRPGRHFFFARFFSTSIVNNLISTDIIFLQSYLSKKCILLKESLGVIVFQPSLKHAKLNFCKDAHANKTVCMVADCVL